MSCSGKVLKETQHTTKNKMDEGHKKLVRDLLLIAHSKTINERFTYPGLPARLCKEDSLH